MARDHFIRLLKHNSPRPTASPLFTSPGSSLCTGHIYSASHKNLGAGKPDNRCHFNISSFLCFSVDGIVSYDSAITKSTLFNIWNSLYSPHVSWRVIDYLEKPYKGLWYAAETAILYKFASYIGFRNNCWWKIKISWFSRMNITCIFVCLL